MQNCMTFTHSYCRVQKVKRKKHTNRIVGTADHSEKKVIKECSMVKLELGATAWHSELLPTTITSHCLFSTENRIFSLLIHFKNVTHNVTIKNTKITTSTNSNKNSWPNESKTFRCNRLKMWNSNANQNVNYYQSSFAMFFSCAPPFNNIISVLSWYWLNIIYINNSE